MRIRLAFPDSIVSPATIAAALEASTVANEALGARGALPDIEHAIRDRLVRWKPEPFTDGEHFDLAPEVLRRGWGDCDDLAPWLAAQLRMEGEDARAVAIRSGAQRYHAVVEREDGQILDPSKWAGMGSSSSKGVAGHGYHPLVEPGWNALALVPHHNGWGARADLALDGDEHFASVSWDPDPKRALDRAVAGLIAGCDGYELELGDGLADLAASCAPIASVARGRAYSSRSHGPMSESLNVGFGLSDITDMAASAIPGGGIANSLLKGAFGGKGGAPAAAPDGGGGGAPVTAPIAAPAGSKAKGGGNLTYVPGGGPIIVRF